MRGVEPGGVERERRGSSEREREREREGECESEPARRVRERAKWPLPTSRWIMVSRRTFCTSTSLTLLLLLHLRLLFLLPVPSFLDLSSLSQQRREASRTSTCDMISHESHSPLSERYREPVVRNSRYLWLDRANFRPRIYSILQSMASRSVKLYQVLLRVARLIWTPEGANVSLGCTELDGSFDDRVSFGVAAWFLFTWF